ncbi:MAG: hypothetical protein ACE5NM_03560 [Sedimentisphaerales bacterium]
MDSTNLISTAIDTGYSILDTSNQHPASRIQVAKDFESVLLNKLLDEMKNTIGDWGFEKDGVSKQVQGIFWLYLAQDIANKGGFGLWKEIYKFLTGAEQTNNSAESLNRNV